jgi:hypothetical protein
LRAECHGPDSSAGFNRTAAVRSKGVINSLPDPDLLPDPDSQTDPDLIHDLDLESELDPD